MGSTEADACTLLLQVSTSCWPAVSVMGSLGLRASFSHTIQSVYGGLTWLPTSKAVRLQRVWDGGGHGCAASDVPGKDAKRGWNFPRRYTTLSAVCRQAPAAGRRLPGETYRVCTLCLHVARRRAGQPNGQKQYNATQM